MYKCDGDIPKYLPGTSYTHLHMYLRYCSCNLTETMHRWKYPALQVTSNANPGYVGAQPAQSLVGVRVVENTRILTPTSDTRFLLQHEEVHVGLLEKNIVSTLHHSSIIRRSRMTCNYRYRRQTKDTSGYLRRDTAVPVVKRGKLPSTRHRCCQSPSTQPTKYVPGAAQQQLHTLFTAAGI